jgi:hypothetical protein
MGKANNSSFKKRFKTRAFASFGVLFSFLVTAFAGIILYLRPEGSLANWTRWNVLGVDKKGWEGIHTLFIILFIIFVILHLYFNWKPLLNYLRKKASESARAKVEFAASLLAVILLLVAAVNRWQPFWKVIDLRSAIKAGKYSVKLAPPVINAEELSLADLCAQINMPADEAMNKLGAAGFKVEDAKITLAKLAKKHNASPENLFRIIIGQ